MSYLSMVIAAVAVSVGAIAAWNWQAGQFAFAVCIFVIALAGYLKDKKS